MATRTLRGSLRDVKAKLDPDWHKARVAARILLKARRRPLNPRDRRLALRFADDPSVSNRLIEQAISFWRAPYRTGPNGERLERCIHVVV
jgi:hypothetical protein